MPPAFERYAIYWAPDTGNPLWTFACAWLGHDPESGRPVTARERLGLDGALHDRIVADPARYGIHATLKAPFRLAPGRTCEDLAARLRAFAAARRSFDAGTMRLAEIGGFLALVPQAPSDRLRHLATACVVGFDDLRGPLDAADRARRATGRYGAHQRLLLEQWGYPHVLSEFRFHVTLTGRLDEAERAKALSVLRPAVAGFCASPLEISGLVLFGDPGGGQPFRLLARYPLAAR
jgi:putative phosphonate metabolism protein